MTKRDLIIRLPRKIRMALAAGEIIKNAANETYCEYHNCLERMKKDPTYDITELRKNWVISIKMDKALDILFYYDLW